MWAPFADVVQAWVAQQHATMSVQPWFTPEVKALIPDKFLLPVSSAAIGTCHRPGITRPRDQHFKQADSNIEITSKGT